MTTAVEKVEKAEIMLQPTIRIRLTQGKIAVISEMDAARVLAHRWSANFQHRAWYVVSAIKTDSGFRGVSLHRFILGEPSGIVDHRNGDPLDNRRSNLRLASRSQNAANMAKRGLKGVSRAGNRWLARIRVNGNCLNLGCFQTPQEAASAYNKAAAIHFGEFAKTNIL